MGQFLLSPPAVFFWIVAMGGVLLRQSGKLGHARGEHWWHHCTHFIMLIAMLAMYCAMVFGKEWFPRSVWSLVYVAITLAVSIWILIRYKQCGAVSRMWALALVSQVAMLYMCLPMNQWIPLVSYAFAFYFACEGLSWLRHALLEQDTDGSTRLLQRRPNVDSLCMTLMAAAMGYMFIGMQLKASERAAVPTTPTPAAAKNDASPSTPISQHENPPLAKDVPVPPAPELRHYTVVAGDSPSRVAARLYGDHRRWKDILKSNPGVDPRRLRAGQIINAPL